MSTKEAVSVASRTLAVLLTVWALTELSYLPGTVHSYLRYAGNAVVTGSGEYWRHSYLIAVGFRVTRIIGYALMARWLHKGGPEVAELLLPATALDDHSAN